MPVKSAAKKTEKKSAKKKSPRALASSPQIDVPKLHAMLQEKCKVENLPIIPPDGAIDVREYSPVEVCTRLKGAFQDIYQQLKEGTWPSLEVPLRRRENILYDERGNLFFGGLKQKLPYDGEYRDFLQTIRTAQVVNDILSRGLHSTKREVFYCDVNLFKEQVYSDRAIENLATILGTRRKCLNVLASEKGTCIGRLQIKDKNNIINCEKLGRGGWAISSILDQVDILESDAEFVLVVEKDAAVIRLSDIKFWKNVPCIIITAKGQSDRATHEFIRRLVTDLHIPALGLCDSDPYGLDILLNYAHGSVQSAYETPWMAVNDMWWLGVRPSDFDAFHVASDCRQRMDQMDMRRADYLLQDPQIQNNPVMKQEVELMLQTQEKAEIQALSRHGANFLVEYIVQKLETGDFVHL